MKIEVFGSEGCSTCKKLKEDIEGLVKKMNISAEVIKVEDPAELAKKGIMSTPAVAIDNEIKFKGRVPNEEELKEAINK